MSLRRQLLLVSLALLSLPWAGCQFVREMETALRFGQEQSLQSTAKAIATALKDQPELLYPYPDRLRRTSGSARSLYAQQAHQPLIIDGYADGWEEWPSQYFSSAAINSRLHLQSQSVIQGDTLLWLLKVEDPQVVYHNPGLSSEANGDHLVIRTGSTKPFQDYIISTAAPGSIKATSLGGSETQAIAARIRGQWQDSQLGYTLELEIPLEVIDGRLGFYIVNKDGNSSQGTETLGNITPSATSPPPWLIYMPSTLTSAIAPFAQTGQKLEIVDRQRWRLARGSATAQANANTQDGEAKPTFWLVKALYRSILSDQTQEPSPADSAVGRAAGAEIDAALAGSLSKQRYSDPGHASRTMLSTAAPLLNEKEVIGAVVIKQSSEQYLSLTDQAFTRLLGYSLVAIGVGITGLLGYASILSWRIRKLSNAASNAIKQDEVSLYDFPRSKARDEIGELSRGYADLLEKVKQYNAYLQSLSRKLSHELRTPVAVIQTSLENLQQTHLNGDDRAIYVNRARTGLERLGGILNAMSEANSLEQSIQSNARQPVDLARLLEDVFGAYQGVYTQHTLNLQCNFDSALTLASPELLVQALDKLMDNAASFAPPGKTITLGLLEVGDRWCLQVENEGPTLPEEMRGQLFNSMVSVREDRSEDIHLGLGLHVVQLIATFHKAELVLDNLPDNSGVRCSMYLVKAAQH